MQNLGFILVIIFKKNPLKPTEKIQALWIVVLFNLLFADILSIFVELVKKDTLDILGEVSSTMAIAALITNIPILMIYFSRSLAYKWNRIANIVAGIITLVFVLGGGSMAPHYLVCAGIEVICILLILRAAWNWTDEIMPPKPS